MFRIGIKKHFSSAHYLRGYKGKCEDLHGHNWQVEVTVAAANLDELGMVMDFQLLKQRLSKVLEELDHRLLNELPAFQHQSPTAENLARHVYERLTDRLPEERVKLDCVRVWESDTTAAAYLEPCSP